MTRGPLRLWPRRPLFGKLLVGILLAAGLARALLLAEFQAKELGLEAHPRRDMHHYHRAAQRVLAGDLALRGSVQDFRLSVDHMGEAAFFRLNQSREPLTQAPLYSYCLATTLLLSDSTLPARALQLAGGVLVAYLTFVLTLGVGGSERAALLAALLAAFHPAAAFYSAFLLRDTLLSVLGLAFVLALTRYTRGPSLPAAAAVGAALGLLHLTKTVLALGLPAAIVGLALGRPRGRAALTHAGAALVGFLLTISPLLVRAAACGTPPLHNEGFVHMGVVAFNHPGADGAHLVWPPAPIMQRILARSSPSPLSCLTETLREYPRPSAFAWLLTRKLRALWNAYEAPNNLSLHDYACVLVSLRAFPVSGLILLPLGLVGALAGLRRLSRTWPLYLGLTLALVPCLAAAPLSRYRVPAIPFLAALAALLLSELPRASRRQRMLALAALTAASWLAWPTHSTRPAAHQAHQRVGMAYTEIDDARRASRHAMNAVRSHPLATAPPAGLRAVPEEGPWAEFVALHRWAYDMTTRAGHTAEASEVRRRLAFHFGPARDPR